MRKVLLVSVIFLLFFGIQASAGIATVISSPAQTNGVICQTDDANLTLEITGASNGQIYTVEFQDANLTIGDINGAASRWPSAPQTAIYAQGPDFNITVEVPNGTTVGSLLDINVLDLNLANDHNSNKVYIRKDYTLSSTLIFTDGTYTEANYFCGAPAATLAAMSNLQVTDTSGRILIEWKQPVNISSDVDFSTGITVISSEKVSITKGIFKDKTAKVTFTNVDGYNRDNLRIYKDDSICGGSDCYNIEIENDGDVAFFVDGFSTYELKKDTSGGGGMAPEAFKPDDVISEALGDIEAGDLTIAYALVLVGVGVMVLALIFSKKKGK